METVEKLRDAAEKLRDAAAGLLREGQVRVVIGYGLNGTGNVTPVFIHSAEEAGKLTWSDRCCYNLTNYLRDSLAEGEKGRVGVVAKGCDARAIVGLIQEHQLRREDIVILGVECHGQTLGREGKYRNQCYTCDVHIPKIHDVLIPSPPGAERLEKPPVDPVAEIEGKTVAERWQYWREQFALCIRCYACRQICPLCYCEQCIVDCNQPRWCSPAPSVSSNTAWNLIRAYHLAGRCAQCGECERACPVGIPLATLNAKLARETKELFNYVAGESEDAAPPLVHFEKEDREDFIR